MKQLYYVIQTLIHGRGSYVIKIISLGLGLTMSILLFSRVVYEQSFDTCFKENDHIYQLWSYWKINGELHGPKEENVGSLAGGLMEGMPDEVECATTIGHWVVSSPLYNGNIRFDEEKVAADSLFFKTLGIEVLSGDPINDLAQKDVVYLSRRLAAKIFGGENPIGKVISYDKRIDLTVRGTYATIPYNATMRPEAVVSMPTVWSREIGNYSWSGGDSWTEYIRLKHADVDLDRLNKRIDNIVKRHCPDTNDFAYMAKAAPIRDTYRGYDEVKRMKSIMLTLGVAILFITALNYVLISISSLNRRAKAIGVHKCSGAGAGTVFGMFAWETLIIILLALALMGFLMLNFQEFVEELAAAKLEALFAPERVWVPLSVTIVLFLIGCVLPGLMFARIPVTQVFRRYTEGKKSWKRPLLFIQFAGVAFLCALMCVVMMQYHYVVHKDSGYDPRRIAFGSVNAAGLEGFGSGSEAREAMLRFYQGLPYVEAVTSSLYYPCGDYSGQMIPDDAGTKLLFSSRYDYCMGNYTTVMGMTVKEGRAPRESGEIAVNEEFVRLMHWEKGTAIGRLVKTEESTDKVKVVGVLKDFNIGGFYEKPKPFCLHYSRYMYGNANIRLKEPFMENLQKLNKEAAEAFPGSSATFESMPQMVLNTYKDVRIFRNSTLLAAVVILFITLMGLIGYTNDELQRRSKEIAIRKVNGAEVSTILEMIVRNILWISLPAVAIGTLGAWYVGELWMEQFAETVDSIIPYCIMMAVLVLCIIIGCVLGKTWRIANENPVKSIKSE